MGVQSGAVWNQVVKNIAALYGMPDLMQSIVHMYERVQEYENKNIYVNLIGQKEMGRKYFHA